MKQINLGVIVSLVEALETQHEADALTQYLVSFPCAERETYKESIDRWLSNIEWLIERGEDDGAQLLLNSFKNLQQHTGMEPQLGGKNGSDTL